MARERIVTVIFQQLLGWVAKLRLGNSMVHSVMAQEEKVSWKRYRKILRRKRKLSKQFNESKSYLRKFNHRCLEHISPVSAPIALVSQVQRSGGSLLSQLFDGHPELHAHPYELRIGYPEKYLWPQIDLNDRPERWFEVLFEDVVIQLFRKGYKKGDKYDETFLFVFLPSLQRRIFLKYVNSLKSITHRDVFDAYMTSYFGAWLNNQNSYGKKRFITAFTARLAMAQDNLESFFGIYPDGRLISLIRDPKNWYPSAIRHKPRICSGIRDGMEVWKKNAQAILRNKERYGDRVCVLTFEDLISKAESVMRYLARFLEIKFDNILLEPTKILSNFISRNLAR